MCNIYGVCPLSLNLSSHGCDLNLPETFLNANKYIFSFCKFIKSKVVIIYLLKELKFDEIKQKLMMYPLYIQITFIT